MVCSNSSLTLMYMFCKTVNIVRLIYKFCTCFFNLSAKIWLSFILALLETLRASNVGSHPVM